LGFVLIGCASTGAPTAEERRALAPTGKLRVGLYVPFEPLVFPSIGALVDSARSREWNVAFLAVSPERAKEVDFMPPHLEIELGYLVPAGSSISTSGDVDRPGVRVGTPEKSVGDTILSRSLTNATVVRTPGLAAGLEMLKSGQVDVFGANKPNLFELSAQLPGSRVLADRFATLQYAMAVPKGHALGTDYLRKFIEDAKSEGLVGAAIERSGLRGAVVAPRQ